LVADIALYCAGRFNSSGTLIQTISIGLSTPGPLALDSSGNLYVGNGGANTVSEFNSSGTLINGSFISGLHSPGGLAFDRSGNLYVANAGNSTISEFNSAGNLINTLSDPSLNGPDGIAIAAVPEPVSTPTVYGAIAVGFVLVCRLMRRALA
jgi:DNA-binding beta-propeller fold protein YncE